MNIKKSGNGSSVNGLRDIGLLTMIPMVMVAGLVVGYFFGNWVDQKFQTSPWGKVVLCILGIIAGVRQTIDLIRKSIKESDKPTDKTRQKNK